MIFVRTYVYGTRLEAMLCLVLDMCLPFVEILAVRPSCLKQVSGKMALLCVQAAVVSPGTDEAIITPQHACGH